MMIAVTLEPITEQKASDFLIAASRQAASKAMAEHITTSFSQLTFPDHFDLYLDQGDDRPARLIACTDMIALSVHYPRSKNLGFRATRGMTMDNITFPLIDKLDELDVRPFWPSMLSLTSIINERWPLPPSQEAIIFNEIGAGAQKRTLDKLKIALEPPRLYQIEPTSALDGVFLLDGGERGVYIHSELSKARSALTKWEDHRHET